MLCLFYKYLSKDRDISKQCLIRKRELQPREIERKLYFPEDPSFVSGLTSEERSIQH